MSKPATSDQPQRAETSNPKQHPPRRLRRPLRSVALIGVDGSGKTTIARRLMNAPPVPMKYLYMGVSVESSNVTLPTSRLIHWWKVRRVKRAYQSQGVEVPPVIHLHGIEHRTVKRGTVASFARLVHRVAEESFRQAVSWWYQWRGFVVLYDRHFLFDCCLPTDPQSPPRLADRWHSWFLRRLFPRPDLVIFLDAAIDVLYDRKCEVPPDYLQACRTRLLANAKYADQFVRLDTSQPVDQVVEQVEQWIVELT